VYTQQLNKITSLKPHKFFERFLDNDLGQLSTELINRYEKIKLAEVHGVTPLSDNEIWQDSGSVSTMKWKQYNVFQFHIPEVYNLYRSISEMIKEACVYYGLDFEKEQFMVQGWFNINYSDSGKLGWHEHGGSGAPYFHGYYCVKAEPSVTHYNVFGKMVDNINKNNRAIISEMGHAHSMGDWDWNGPRITVAYDILPLRNLVEQIDQEQHWIPLI
jgi:hypothetical protein